MNSDVEVLGNADARSRGKVLDYIELMKPELTGLSVLTTLCGFYLATVGSLNYWLFFHTALGTLLVGGGAGTLNQYAERKYDAMMKRTERRPLPAGRLDPSEVLIFGIVISVLGIIELSVWTNFLTGFLGAITWTTYLFLYTPLKRVTHLSTLIGGIPGAIPPMMGWAAVRNDLTVEAWILFAILFCWQMPHFFSLAWMYRKDYARAGFKILTVMDEHGRRTSRQILLYCIVLIPASLAPAYFGMTGMFSIVTALVLGSGFLVYGSLLSRFSRRLEQEALGKINVYSRRMFFASLVYLPTLMIVLSLDKM
ncbi:MAG: protoheme IX farnesyltransferase [Ignavibacteriae bacterium]|nr:protoheme IX farnesyltransferase [Ignavibacteria bacterium]MBI3363489.1 protoheme IX farnesyltransferase [Ignavibacteriota bacterium]